MPDPVEANDTSAENLRIRIRFLILRERFGGFRVANSDRMVRKMIRAFLWLLLCGLLGSPLAAQRRFTLEVQGGATAGGLRDEMYSPLNYAASGFRVGLGGQYRFGKSQVGISLDFGYGQGKTAVSDYFRTDYYGVGISGAYLRNVWQPSAGLGLWVGGSYRFSLDGSVWQRTSYSYIASHAFSPQARLEWAPAERHLLSTGLSLYLLGWVMRPPYNYMPEFYDDEKERNYLWYLMRQLREADFALIGRYWDIAWEAGYHYRLSPRFQLGMRYAFRYLRYPRPQPFIRFDNQILLSAKIRL